jgi:DNA polymerase III psi subunit
MNEATRRAYLEALDIPVWIRKEHAEALAAEPVSLLRAGPGSGQVLLVCNAQEEPASRIAADVSRALGAEPVWAWPEDGAGGHALADLVADRLLTAVVIFGKGLAAGLLGSGEAERLGSARVLLAPGFDELAGRPQARRALWDVIRRGGLDRGSADA